MNRTNIMFHVPAQITGPKEGDKPIVKSWFFLAESTVMAQDLALKRAKKLTDEGFIVALAMNKVQAITLGVPQ